MNDSISRPEASVIPPSSVYVFWPGDQPPNAEEIRLSLSELGHPAAFAELDSAEGTLWSFWFEVAERPVSHLVWCEPISGEYLGLLDSMRWKSFEQREIAGDCKWMVGIEGPVSLKDPTLDYQIQLRMADHIAREWSPVVFDASAMVFRSVEEVRRLANARMAPRVNALFSIHKVQCNKGSGSAEPIFWLHTHGLERAAMPDIEIFDVPESLLTAACELIESVADLWTEYSTPEPETPFSVGHDLEIAWRPWHAVIASMDKKGVGGWAYRREELGHNGYRAVLVAPKRDRWLSRNWSAPVEAMKKLSNSATTIYKTASETRRMAQIAKDQWATFGLIFASRHPDDWRFAVKIHFAVSPESGRGEHLWFDVHGMQPGRVLGVLVSTPTMIPKLRAGDAYWNEINRVTDWRIFTPDEVFDPDSAERLLETV